ncbi:MAG: hypothetical protein HC822_02570 [Oscillochloris sp.]|nr:hypothetical protein [Oscillochloris sp.]
MATEIKPPAPLILDPHMPSLFLAGSIEQGRAVDWQTEVVTALADIQVTILNPRRAAWDASWRQTIDNKPFRNQVEWELTALERADLIAMYIAPETQAPISLLELGLFAAAGKLIVCCPDGFWRKGNVDIVCARYAIPQVADLTDLIGAVRQRLI